jgi:hypothetical protein
MLRLFKKCHLHIGFGGMFLRNFLVIVRLQRGLETRSMKTTVRSSRGVHACLLLLRLNDIKLLEVIAKLALWPLWALHKHAIHG